MKRRIIVISLCINLMAGLFILYSFIPKEKKNTNEGGSGYIIVTADFYVGKLSVTDGQKDLDNQELNNISSILNSYNKWKENNTVVAKVLNDFALKGYELVSSNTVSHQSGTAVYSYIMQKK